ncbi:MAG: hypothetical protein KatS3mg129_1735 [Leptospiraceae bacterium]|nr:MAG: hypothetical protein KatS3mg129_1735 [Leptospiraceae bacterium]
MFNYLFSQNLSLEKKIEFIHKQIFQIGHAYEDIYSFLNKTDELLKNVFSIQTSFVILTEYLENPIVFGKSPDWFTSSMAKIFYSKIKFNSEELKQLKNYFLSLNKTKYSSNNKLENNHQFNGMIKILNKLKNENYNLFYPIIFQNEIFGFYIAKVKKPLKNHDIYLMDILSISFALAIRNAIIRKENKNLRLQNKDFLNHNHEYIPSEIKPMIIYLENNEYIIASPQMKHIINNIQKLKNIHFPILITGETGTGKEFIARYFHHINKPEKPFIAINCTSIPESLWESELFGYKKGAFTDAKSDKKGLIEEANDGTLFFDEIGEIPLEIQVKLLRLIQEKKFRPIGSTKEIDIKCNFIFATNKNLIDKIQNNEFREDLYYRISTIHFHIPPLRERKEDIIILIEHFIKKHNDLFKKNIHLDNEVYEFLLNSEINPWKGNIRELENYIIKIIFEANTNYITIESLNKIESKKVSSNNFINEIEKTAEELLGLASGMQIDFEKMIKKISKKIITEALERCNGNKTRAAQLLGISRGKLNYQIKELDIQYKSKD